MNAIASDSHAATPALRAAPGPSPARAGRRARPAASATAAVPSREPLSTTITSAPPSAASVAGSVRSASRAGMTTATSTARTVSCRAMSIFKAYDVRGIYGDQIDGDVAEAVGRGFARVIGTLAGKPVAELRLGLGRDMRLTAPELAGRYRDGMVAEGAHVLDAGMVGTEMLYFLVGSQDLDGGLMCTASHNPKQYTGAKMVEKGALALSGDRGLQDIRKLIEAGLGDAPGGGSVEEVDVAARVPRAPRWRSIDPSAIKPLRSSSTAATAWPARWSARSSSGLGLDLETLLLDARRQLPRPRAQPAAARRTAEFIMDKVARDRRRPRHRLGRRRRPLLLHRRHRAASSTATSSPRCSRSRCSRSSPGADILYDVRASRAVPDTVEAAGGTAHINRVGHAFFKTRMRDEGGAFGGEVSGHYYFADFYNADSGTIPALLILELLSKQGAKLSELIDGFRSKYFISGEINSEVDDADGQDGRARGALLATARSPSSTASPSTTRTGTSTCAPSNTEPLLRLNLESLVSEEDMEAKRDEVLGRSSARDDPLPARSRRRGRSGGSTAT